MKMRRGAVFQSCHCHEVRSSIWGEPFCTAQIDITFLPLLNEGLNQPLPPERASWLLALFQPIGTSDPILPIVMLLEDGGPGTHLPWTLVEWVDLSIWSAKDRCHRTRHSQAEGRRGTVCSELLDDDANCTISPTWRYVVANACLQWRLDVLVWGKGHNPLLRSKAILDNIAARLASWTE